MLQGHSEPNTIDDPLVRDSEWQVPREIELVDHASRQAFPWEAAGVRNWWRDGGITAFRTERLVGEEEREGLGKLCLSWTELTADEQVSPSGTAAPPTHILDEFVRLADADPDRILQFARLYGPLRICGEHGAPWSECRLRSKVLFRDGSVVRFCEMIRPEPVVLWYAYARSVRGILSLAAAMHRGSPRSRLDKLAAEMVGCSVESFKRHAKAMRRFHHGHLLHEAAGRWVRLLHPDIVRRGDSELRYRLHGSGLLGAIGKHLVFALMRGEGLAACSGCGVPYVPSRKPRSGDRSFCKRCHDNKVPQKLAQRDYRKREEQGST